MKNLFSRFIRAGSVHQPAVSFGPFSAADLKPAFAGQSGRMKAAIRDTVRQLYGDYRVTILSSDDGPEPVAAHAIIYFGGDNGAYCGMGDAVDQYDADPSGRAIVYTDTFAPFAAAGLTLEETARMIGNAASHELGHLLGLFHARDSKNVMDETRSAADLAAESYVARAPLAETVFPVGVEDEPALLAESVGRAH